jgi:hypothetical protein
VAVGKERLQLCLALFSVFFKGVLPAVSVVFMVYTVPSCVHPFLWTKSTSPECVTALSYVSCCYQFVKRLVIFADSAIVKIRYLYKRFA